MNEPAPDPVARSRREALVVAAIWLAALVYTVTYCGRYGYGAPADELQFVLGFPSWVFWGILVPWTACTAASCLFAFAFMADEDLGEEPTGDDAEGGRGDS